MKRLVACPLCGYKFREQESRPKHFLDNHGPEDCQGVTPIGERPPSATEPLFDEQVRP